MTSCLQSMSHPFSASRRARTAICISAMRCRRCSISSMARAAGGRLLLRIEDIDATRCRPEFEQAIYEDLAWLGHRLGAAGAAADRAFRDYRAALGALDALGLVYPSFESRAEIARLVAERERNGSWPRDPDGAPLYPGEPARCRRPSAGGACRRASPTRCGSTWRRRMARDRRADLDARPGRDRAARAAWSRPRPRPGATWCWRARRRRPAITSRSWSTTRCKA